MKFPPFCLALSYLVKGRHFFTCEKVLQRRVTQNAYITTTQTKENHEDCPVMLLRLKCPLHLDYSYGICLLSYKFMSLGQMGLDLENEAKGVELKINKNKSKMSFWGYLHSSDLNNCFCWRWHWTYYYSMHYERYICLINLISGNADSSLPRLRLFSSVFSVLVYGNSMWKVIATINRIFRTYGPGIPGWHNFEQRTSSTHGQQPLDMLSQKG